jgi:hypothetical protein
MVPQASLRFREPGLFARFCLALRHQRVPFGLVGSHTVALSEDDLRGLESEPERLFAEAQRRGLVEVAAPTTRRPTLLTQEETEALLWKLSQAR